MDEVNRHGRINTEHDGVKREQRRDSLCKTLLQGINESTPDRVYVIDGKEMT